MKKKLKKGLEGTYGWSVSNFIEANDLHDIARETMFVNGCDHKWVEEKLGKPYSEMTNDELIELIGDYFSAEDGWDILGDEYVHTYPHPDDYYEVDDYCLIERVQDVEKEALHNAKCTFGIRDNKQILLVPKVKREKVQNYVHTVQIGFDIAIPEGMDGSDVEKFMENEVATFIEKTSRLEVLNGIFCAEDMSHSYDIDEVNKMANPKTK